MFAGLFASRRTKSLVRREQRRPATGFEALEPRLAMAVTLVIDPSNLKLPATSSAWVAGYANVQGGKADQPFTWLASSGANAAKFVVPTSTTDSGAALPMIQIWGGDVSGTTTITIDTTALGVRLRGIVLNAAERSAVEQVAAAVSGVGDVDNQLRLMTNSRQFSASKT